MYPSDYLNQFGAWLSYKEPHQVVWKVADKVDSLEDRIEPLFIQARDRLTAYSQLQEAREEIAELKRDRGALTQTYVSLAGLYKTKTGEESPEPSPRSREALLRAARDVKPTLARMRDIFSQLPWITQEKLRSRA